MASACSTIIADDATIFVFASECETAFMHDRGALRYYQHDYSQECRNVHDSLMNKGTDR